MINAELQNECVKVASILCQLKRELAEVEVSLDDTNLTALTIQIYNRKRDVLPVAKSTSTSVPDGQVFAKGARCLKCAELLKLSKKGNYYCDCWYKVDNFGL